ncbi:MAG TPA: type II toxin-antitoxin system PemK/MazF family toxin [Microthrixaceae bacterium]|nr:type II toxin-antitoxin system PemK/MazF family toxin [Microthrixaceae bacterium]HNI35635.1 type II toxin-antitoxin system PemK/MazF family toxin [Microthrixaceae bacterium]
MVNRGGVWWVDFGAPFGSEPGFVRPALVVSSDRFNRSRIGTVIVVAITSNLRLGEAPGNVRLASGTAGLARESVVNVSQTMVVDRRRLSESSGALDRVTMRAVDAGLRLVLSL